MTGPAIGLPVRTYRHAARYRQVLGILIKYGFGEIAERVGVGRRLRAGFNRLRRGRPDDAGRVGAPRRARKMLEELGPTFVKLGQVLSMRPDLLPPEYLQELRKLQQAAQPFPFQEAREIVEKDLGRPLDEVFREVDRDPLAAASIAQVHRATLEGGQEVVVKVRRPGIEKVVGVDLDILARLAGLAEHRGEEWSGQSPTQIVEEVKRVIQKEMDFTVEATHLARMTRLFKDDETVRIPRVYAEATSRGVLTMEKLDGVPITDREALARRGLDATIIARRLTELMLTQILVHGFFHADPHPGNVRALPGNVVCLLDLGMMGRLGRKDREAFANLVYAMGDRDPPGASSALLAFTEPLDSASTDLRRLEADLADFIDLHIPERINELELGPFVHELLQLVRRHRLRLPPDMVTMLKTIVTLDQVVRSLDPALDVVEIIVARIREIRLSRSRSTRLLKDAAAYTGDLMEIAGEVPPTLRDILRMTRLGRLKIGLEHRRLENVLETHERVSNRVSFAIVVAALIVGSSMIVHSQLPPLVGEIPLIGLIGFLLAGTLGLLLLVSILRRGRL
jgi:ubiquinone biosynthesis protein